MTETMSTTVTLFLVSLFLLTVDVVGQITHTVEVGVEGSFYDPQTVAAGMGDIITFIFGGDIHDVTQSTFDDPCTPLPGGFSSGLAGRGSNFSGAPPVWNLEITNVSGPLWFFCGATKPTSHCAAGMVGAINPPSQAMYLAFQAAAKNTSATATAAVTFVGGGQGAFATNSPIPSSVSGLVTSAAPTSSSSVVQGPNASSSVAPVTPPTSSDSGSHLGTIVGGSIGGAVAIAGLVIIAMLVRRSSKRRNTREFFNYAPEHTPTGLGDSTPTPSTAMKPAFGDDSTTVMGQTVSYGSNATGSPRMLAGRPLPNQNQNQNQGATLAHPYSSNHSTAGWSAYAAPGTPPKSPQMSPTTKFSPVRGDQDVHPYAIDRDDDSTDRDAPSAANLNLLAKEVAAVILQQSNSRSQLRPEEQDRKRKKGRDQVQNAGSAADSASRESDSTAPPLYRSGY